MTSGNQKNYLVTGGLGFIGCRLVNRLLSLPDTNSVIVLDNFSVGSLTELAVSTANTEIHEAALEGGDRNFWKFGKLEVRRGDIGVAEDMASAMSSADIIVHLAAQTGVPASVEDPIHDFKNNVQYLVSMLDLARRLDPLPHIVFASSNAPLGIAQQPVSEKTLPKPISPYGASKLTGENYLSAFAAAYGLSSVSLRFGNVYGPGSFHKTSVVAKFIRQALQGEVLEIYGDGSQTRDFIHIDDLVDAILAACNYRKTKSEVFQISAGAETPIGTLTDILNAAFTLRGINKPEVRFGLPRAGDMDRNVSDVSKAKDLLGWQVRRSLDRGILETLDWFLAQPEANTR